MYLENFKALVEGLRKETGVAELPVVLGSYRDGGLPENPAEIDPVRLGELGDREGALLVLQAQYDAQKALPPCKMVALRNIERHPRNVHYNTKGQLALGRVLAEGYLELTEEE